MFKLGQALSPVKEHHAVERFKALDSLRGIAAVFVVFSHFYQVIPMETRHGLHELDSVLWSVAMAGRFSVIFFFVLSGFVLSLPYWAGTHLPYSTYAIKRFVRLYVPFAFAVLIAALLSYALGGHALGSGADTNWSTPITADALFSALAMTGVEQPHFKLDDPIWSLVVEMRLSLIFPVLVLLVARSRWLAVCAGIVFAFACSKLYAERGGMSELTANDLIGSVLLTGRYTVLFVFGIFLSSRLENIRRMLRRVPRALHIIVGISGIVMHCVLTLLNLEGHGYADLLYGLIAAYLIACLVTFPNLAALVSGRGALWLGDISYSLYLIHLPLLLGTLYLLDDQLPLAANMALSLPVIFIGAHLMHVYIEKPSMNLGRKVAETVRS